VQGIPSVSYEPSGDEHGNIKSKNGPLALAVGDRMYLIPSHIDTTINLHDHYLCHRKGILEEV
jgi:D-serine deaminase-like pyridoxal phosphate-dependent protein